LTVDSKIDHMQLRLTIKDQPHVPLEADSICPDATRGLTLDAVKMLPIWLGKRKLPLSDFFDVDGETANGDAGDIESIDAYGDLSRVKWIGKGMSRGALSVHGSVGMHLGAFMKGGRIEVTGGAGDWIGAEMTGGLIRVGGDAGGQIGAAYRGSMTGMRNGTILIGGGAGLEVGSRMKKGVIVIGGPAKDFVGLQMKGGTIVLMKGAELRTGAWMARGTIVSLAPLPLLPTFTFSCRDNPTFMPLLASFLSEHGVALPHLARDGDYEVYSGDTSVPGMGELLIGRPRGANGAA
jgi:formylmethanofuran dehydrogenase subunit C